MMKVVAQSDQQITVQTGQGYAVVKALPDDIHVKYGNFVEGHFEIYAYDKLPDELFGDLHDGTGWNMEAVEKLVTKPLEANIPVPCLSLKMHEMTFIGEVTMHIEHARVRVFSNAVSVDWRVSVNGQITQRHKFFSFRHDPDYRFLHVAGTWDFDKLNELIKRYAEGNSSRLAGVNP